MAGHPRDWAELRTALLAFHPDARDVPNGIRFVLAFDAVRVGLYACAIDDVALAIHADLGPAGTHDPTEILEWNGVLRSEALAIVDGTLVVRAVVDRALEIEEIERRIQQAARVGALFKQAVQHPPAPAPFVHYTE